MKWPLLLQCFFECWSLDGQLKRKSMVSVSHITRDWASEAEKIQGKNRVGVGHIKNIGLEENRLAKPKMQQGSPTAHFGH